MDLSAAAQLRQEIDKAVTWGGDGVSLTSVTAIKSLVRADAAHAPKVAVEALLVHLRAAHSQERLAALIIADVLFQRSHAFRQGFVRHMDAVVAHASGCIYEQPLPPPAKYARKLREEFGRMLTRWNASFGAKHKAISLALGFVKSKMQGGGRGAGHGHAERDDNEMQRVLSFRKAEQIASARKSLGVFRERMPGIQEHIFQARQALHMLVSFPGDSLRSGDFVGAVSAHRNALFASVLETSAAQNVEQGDYSEGEEGEYDDDDMANLESSVENVLHTLGFAGMGYKLDVTLPESGLRERVKEKEREEGEAAHHGLESGSVVETLRESRRKIEDVEPELRTWRDQMLSVLARHPNGSAGENSSRRAAAQPASARFSDEEVRLVGTLTTILTECQVILDKCTALGICCKSEMHEEHGVGRRRNFGEGEGKDRQSGDGLNSSGDEMEDVDVYTGPNRAVEVDAEAGAHAREREDGAGAKKRSREVEAGQTRKAEGDVPTAGGLSSEIMLRLAQGTGWKLGPKDGGEQRSKKRRKRGEALAVVVQSPAKAAMDKGRKVLKPSAELCKHREVIGPFLLRLRERGHRNQQAVCERGVRMLGVHEIT